MSELQRQLNVETIVTAQGFQDLVGLAVESCLESPDAYIKALQEIHDNSPPADPVIARNGLWGVGKALEEMLNLKDIDTLKHDYTPEGLVVAPDIAVQEKIEAFGKALLEEAFNCLGADAPAMVTKFKSAQTLRQKINVCKWLKQRIYEIKAVAPKFEEESLYHPLRLSPVAIGRYPEIHCDTTCLGYSVLLASFFEKAQVPYFHTGVASTAGGEARRAQNSMMDNTAKVTTDLKTTLPYPIVQTFVDVAMENLDAIQQHNGFHASIAARLDEKNWYQLDPNFRSNIIMDPTTSKKYEQAYTCLKDLEASGTKGVETMLVNRPGIYPHFFNGNTFTAMIETCFLPDEAEEFLAELDPQEPLPEIIDEVFYRLLNPAEDVQEEFVQSLVEVYSKSLGMSYHEYMQEVIGETIDEYVFPDAVGCDIRACIERCKTDKAYLARRAEDLHLAPFMALMKIQSEIGDDIIGENLKVPHAVVEIGLPQYRIGASVLSDFAVLCGDDLPPSFWLAHWPSQISFAEHANIEYSEAQNTLLAERAETIDAAVLRYRTFDTIIKNILEQGDADGGTG